jgi:uncharacterized protein (TIGR03083 family)
MTGTIGAGVWMHVGHAQARSAFLAALDDFLAVVGGLTDSQLMASSRCRGWTVGDVVVHVYLGLQEMLLGVVAPTDAAPDTDAASYWSSEVPTNDPDADRLDQIRFVRLLGAAYRRPTGLVSHLRPTADGLRGAVSALAPGELRFQGHVMSTGDFLATWAVELAVHHLDLAPELALGPPPPTALRLARGTVQALVGGNLPDSWSDETAVLLGTGRLRLSDSQRQEAGTLAAALPAFG